LNVHCYIMYEPNLYLLLLLVAMSGLRQQLHKQLLQEVERCASLEVELLQQQAEQLQALTEGEQSICLECMGTAADAIQTLKLILTQLQQVWQEHLELEQAAPDTTEVDPRTGPDTAVARQRGWMAGSMAAMLTELQVIASDAVARAQLVAARQDVAIQSDAPCSLTGSASWPALLSCQSHKLCNPKLWQRPLSGFTCGPCISRGRWQQELRIRQGPAGLEQQLAGGSSTLLDVIDGALFTAAAGPAAQLPPADV